MIWKLIKAYGPKFVAMLAVMLGAKLGKDWSGVDWAVYAERGIDLASAVWFAASTPHIDDVPPPPPVE